MLKQRVVISALAVMLALSVSASAQVVVDDTQVWGINTGEDSTWLNSTTNNLRIVELPARTLIIGQDGNLTVNRRTDMVTFDGWNEDISIIINGGILNTATQTFKLPGRLPQAGTEALARVFLNAGRWDALELEAAYTGWRRGQVVIKDGVLWLQRQHATTENYQVWKMLDMGILIAGDGYELVFEDWSGNLVDPYTYFGATDSMKIYAVPTGPVNPVPAEGDLITDLNLANLCWDNYVYESVNVWFGAADANEVNYTTLLTQLGTVGPLAIDGTQVCFSLSGSLTGGTLYSWAVERADGDPNVVVWQFTATTDPQVFSSPTDQSVWPDGMAVFTAQFDSPLEVTSAVWSKGGVPLSGTPDVVIEETSPGSNRYAVTLTITNVAVGDEGAYTCVATNSGGSSLPTAPGYLTVKRTLAYWTFDNTLADTTGVYTPTSIQTPSYVAGVPPISGPTRTALDFVNPGSGFIGQVLEVPNGFASFRAGMTVSTWLNMNSASDASAFILQLGAGGTGDTILLRRITAGGNLVVGTGGGTEVTINGAITFGQWQHIVATVSDDGAFKVFINGVNVHNGSGNTPYAVTRTKNLIGADSATGRNDQFIGLIDEIKIRNYAISYTDVLDEYHGVVGGFTCLEDLEFDLTGDCRVGLGDLALLVSDWLVCGRFPASECPSN